MDNNKPVAALFDLDGVVFDTEPQYTEFWRQIGETYLPEIPHFEQRIKGTTLKQILETYFAGKPDVGQKVCDAINYFEAHMTYPYVPGVTGFLKALREAGVKTAVVTSSDSHKMQNVYNSHPEFKELFDKILTAEYFERSKPDPFCYLLGAKIFDTVPQNSVVFEDSFNGLEAGRRADMFVVGLATTNPEEAIRDKANVVISDFTQLTPEKMLSFIR